MKKNICITLLFVIYIQNTQSQSIKLSGTVIGSGNYFNYTNNLCESSNNIALNAFDGNLQSIFGTCERSGGWVGLDLKQSHIITQIKYCPKPDQVNRMLLGIFEASNSPDFGDAIPILLIKNTPLPNIMNIQNINISKGFRYVRYIGPEDAKCNVNEIELYGYQAIGSNATLPQATNLPSVVIHTTDNREILDRETYIKGIVSFISNNGTAFYSDSLEIRGRGNVSWDFPKKPYRIKLFKKTNLLGMPANERNWTLINNYGDKTLMRNLIAFDISKKLELAYTPAGQAVDVFLNSQYKGTYQLCDHIEVANNRLEVEKQASTVVALPEISGGYLIEMDAYANTETIWFTSNVNRIPTTIKYPKDDDINQSQITYIKNHFSSFENALAGSNYTHHTNGYRQYLDTESFIRHFLVGEISGNTDTYWSTNMYKLRNNDKFYFGPVWDFDIAFENDFRTYPINNNSNWICTSSGSSANGVRNIINRLFNDQSFINEIKTVYAKYRNNGKISTSSLLQLIDNYATNINESQDLNFKRWKIMNAKVHMNPEVWGSYNAEVNNVKNYLVNRISWLDNKLNYVPSSLEFDEIKNIKLWYNSGRIFFESTDNARITKIYSYAGNEIISGNFVSGDVFNLTKGLYIVIVNIPDFGIVSSKCIVK